MNTTETPAAWEDELIAAADTDNQNQEVLCGAAKTREMLADAPTRYRIHAELAISDFEASNTFPLSALRSDTVADEFRVSCASKNLMVARMAVPGGPWPGHFGLESVIFTARPAVFPGWFPPTASQSSLVLGAVHASSAAFRDGHGSVLFPELLSTRKPLQRQNFGVVFIDKLTDLYESHVRSGLDRIGIGSDVKRTSQSARELAFVAHEWGHLHSSDRYAESANTRKNRISAVIGELCADLAGFSMLLDRDTPETRTAAQVLVLDRVVREAWLPRANNQVDSIASRQLLSVLIRGGFATQTSNGRILLDWGAAAVGVEVELAKVRNLESACVFGDLESSLHYLRECGWRTDGRSYHLAITEPVTEAFRSASVLSRQTR